MSVGENLKRARHKKKLSQQEVATFLFCTPQAISRYENNRVEPSLETLKKLCVLFEVSADDILEIPHYRRNKLKSSQ